MSTDDKPTAGWIEYEGQRLLIGDEPTLVLDERTGAGIPSYTAHWYPNGPESNESGENVPREEIFAGRPADTAWPAAVEIGRSAKSRLDFRGVAWTKTWERLDSDPETWRRRADEGTVAPEPDELPDGLELFDDGSLAVPGEDSGAGWFASRRWICSREGFSKQIDRFGWRTGGRDVSLRDVGAVPVVAAAGGDPGAVRLAVAGEGFFERVGEASDIGEVERLRKTVLEAFAGGFESG